MNLNVLFNQVIVLKNNPNHKYAGNKSLGKIAKTDKSFNELKRDFVEDCDPDATYPPAEFKSKFARVRGMAASTLRTYKRRTW